MTSTSKISETELRLLKYLGQSLKNTDSPCEIPDLSNDEWERIYSLANRHEVSVLMGDIFNCVNLSPETQTDLQIKTARTVHKWINLQAIDSRLTSLLEKEGITAVTLKGFAVARLYPVPEFRKTTDIDLFFFSLKDAKKAKKILCENGFKPSDEWHANHHFILVSQKNDILELHTAWADEFKGKRLNYCLEKLQNESRRHCFSIDCDGMEICVYDTAYQAFFLLVHMLGHFVGSGFGLRNLCDWVVLWNNCNDQTARQDFAEMVYESGTQEFAKAVTAVCTEYLGLEKQKSSFFDQTDTDNEVTTELLRDVLDAGEFGKSEPTRMVGMDGNGVLAYIKEFHHQMHINFQKAGKIVFIWPVLWGATLVRFLKNNKKFNRAPVSEIMKKAGNRGKLVKKLISNK